MSILRCVALALIFLWAGPVLAQPSTLVVDAATGKVLSHSNATARLHPASLTKMMTAYLTLEALKSGAVRPDEALPVSARASAQGGATLGLVRGKTITVSEALAALIVRSANDAAVTLAERIGLSEEGFASLMNVKAKALDMSRTTFVNASGMTADGHLSTARDMAVLALALERDFPKHRDLFGKRGITWGKKWLPSVNGFLSQFQGADGMKTGFTCEAGYNLVGTATRGSRHLIGVEMGASNKGERQAIMRRILDKAFGSKALGEADIYALDDGADLKPASFRKESCGPGSDFHSFSKGVAKLSGWALDVGISVKEHQARAVATKELKRLQKELGGGRVATLMRAGDGMISYRALIVGAQEKKVVQTCIAMRERGEDCLVLNPVTLKSAVEDAARHVRFFAE